MDTVYALDTRQGPQARWVRKSSMPIARSAGAAVVHAGRIYVAGGRPPRGHDFAVYDPQTDIYTPINTCFGTHHLMFAEDADNTLWTSGGGQVIGWLNTKQYLATGDYQAAQGWTPFILDTNGNVIAIPITGLRRPCATAIRGDKLLVAELAGRAVLLDKDFKILSELGDNPVVEQRAKFGVPPKDWKEGVFTAPHGCAIDYDGNLYIQDWNKWGRITKLVKTP